MARLHLLQKEQHLLFQRLRGGGHHRGHRQFARQLAQHEPQEHRIVFQGAAVFPKRHRQAEHRFRRLDVERRIARAAEFHIPQQGPAGGLGNIADGSVLGQAVGGNAALYDHVKLAKRLQRIVENLPFFKFHQFHHRRALPEMHPLLLVTRFQPGPIPDFPHIPHLFFLYCAI